MRPFGVLVVLWVAVVACAQGQDKLLLQIPRDGKIEPKPLEERDFRIVEGKAIQFGPAGILRFGGEGLLDRARGTVCMWIKPDWNAAEESSHALFSDDRKFETGNNSLTLWEWHTGQLRFDVRDQGDQYLTADVSGWKAGERRHVAAAWDCRAGTFLFVDGDLRAAKKFTWDPRPGEGFQLGCARGNAWPCNAEIEDVRVYSGALSPGQVRRVMGGTSIDPVSYTALEAPGEITVGREFEATLSFGSPEGLGEGYNLVVSLDNTPLAAVPLSVGRSEKAHRVKVAAVVPFWLYPAPGRHTVRAEVAGASAVGAEKAQKEVELRLPEPVSSARSLDEWQRTAVKGDAFLVDGKVVGREEAASRVDALPVALTDEVDCSQTDHGYWENSPASVETIGGTRFRCVGPQEKVTQLKKREKAEVKALAAFSYRMKVRPRPTPHLIVIESINDAERYVETAIDHPRDSKAGPHLEATGAGDPVAVNLSVTYTGREYATDGKTYRQAFMFFPKTDAVEVMISGTARTTWPEAKPAAVSKIWAYEVASPLADLANPVLLPEGQPQRTVSIFFPAIDLLFEKYGFRANSPEMRDSTLRLFMDYMRFMGLNRFEFRPFGLGPKCHFKCSAFQQAGDLDFFAEALPILRSAGVACVPRVMYLHCYYQLLEDDQDNFQWAASGKIMGFGREGPLPDPLRPPVQKVVLDSITAMIEACKGYENVPAVGFDSSIGGLYGWEFRDSTSLTGYSRWDVEQLASETGTKVPADLDTPAKRCDWIKANCWKKWIAWRCESWHQFVARIRAAAKAAGKKLELSVRIMPREEFQSEHVPIKDIYLQTGFNPDLFRGEEDIQMDYFIRINSDRYFGRPWWKPWFYDAQQPDLFVSREPRHAELYFNYWELPWHPWGFRVGPGSPVGRNFFEPITYLMRKFNPHDLTFFNWFAGTIGREVEVREFCRAFRALPAVEPRDFDGTVTPVPSDDRLWVKWFGDRLAVVNDSPQERDVTLVLPGKGGRVVDTATMAYATAAVRDGSGMKLPIRLRPFDLRAFVFLA